MWSFKKYRIGSSKDELYFDNNGCPIGIGPHKGMDDQNVLKLDRSERKFQDMYKEKE